MRLQPTVIWFHEHGCGLGDRTMVGAPDDAGCTGVWDRNVAPSIRNLEYAQSWSHLTGKEKNYAYFLEKASWAGAKMLFHQLSYESPALFLIFQAYFQTKDLHALEQSVFIKLHGETDVLAEFKLQQEERTGITLPDLPERGNLDLEAGRK